MNLVLNGVCGGWLWGELAMGGMTKDKNIMEGNGKKGMGRNGYGGE